MGAWEKSVPGRQTAQEKAEMAVLPLDAQLPDEGVGDARAHPAEEAREGREERGVLKTGLHDAEAPQKGHGHRADLRAVRLFPQEPDGEEDGEKGRELVEHIGVRQGQVVDGVEVQDQARRAEDRAAQEGWEVFPGGFPGNA